MAGNRRREEAFQIPLLMWLAMLEGDPPESGRGRKSNDLLDVRDSVLRLFQFSSEQRKKTRPKRNGKPYNILDNEVDFAFDQLEGNQEVTRTRRCWEITEKGLERLRRHLHRMLERDANNDEWEALLKSTGSSGNEQLLCVLQSLDEAELAEAVLRAGNTRELFLAAFKITPIERFGGIISFMSGGISEILGRVLRRKYAADLELA